MYMYVQMFTAQELFGIYVWNTHWGHSIRSAPLEYMLEAYAYTCSTRQKHTLGSHCCRSVSVAHSQTCMYIMPNKYKKMDKHGQLTG